MSWAGNSVVFAASDVVHTVVRGSLGQMNLRRRPSSFVSAESGDGAPAAGVSLVRVWGWPIVLAVTVVVASGRGQVAGPEIVNFDKFAHFSIFGLLATLVARALGGGRRRWWGIAVVSLFGMTDEFRQSFTPGRSVEMADWLADTAGAICAVALYVWCGVYRRLLEAHLFGRVKGGRASRGLAWESRKASAKLADVPPPRADSSTFPAA